MSWKQTKLNPVLRYKDLLLQVRGMIQQQLDQEKIRLAKLKEGNQ